ncbi:MAG: sensory box histidine kinase [Bacteroidetes bacterium]|nr:sensory box histidine kinase [Bacteroidota bacterium]
MEDTSTILYQEKIEKAQEQYSKGNIQNALALLDELDSEPYRELPLLIRVKMTSLKGIIYFNQGEVKKAEKYALLSLELAKEYGDPVFIFKRYDNLASIYSYTKEYHLAHDYLQRSIELKEITQHEQDLIPGLLQLAALFFYIDNLEAGKATVERAAKIMSQYPSDDQLVMHFNFLMGMQYKREKKYNEAIIQYDQAAGIARRIGYAHVETRSYTNQGDIFIQQARWAEAEEKFQRSLLISTQHNLGVDEQNICIQLALVALKQGNIARCHELYDKVKSQTRKSRDEVLLKDLEEVGALMYEEEGNYAEALYAFKRHMSHYKKQYDNELSSNIVNIQAKYESEKAERQLKESRLLQVESELKVLQAEHALQETEKRFRTLIENSTDGIVLMSETRTPIYVSPYVYKILDYNEQEIIGTDVFSMVHPQDQEYMSQIGVSILAHPGVPFHGQFRFPKKNGEYIWIEGTALNLLDDEAVKGVVCNFRDISERKENEHAIQELNKSLESLITDRTAELQEVVKDLEAFSYSVSHDLRSPLRIIAGYAKLILSDHGHSINEEAKEFVETILENTKRMGQLIDDLLNFSRLGRKALYKSPIDMKAMVNMILRELPKANDALPEDITIHNLHPAYADHALTKQIWVNLISNAIKYSSKKDHPVIEIGCYQQDKEMVYYIKDNGAGFDMRFAHNLFGVFKRLHDRSEFDGIGVGLALAHRIIKMHEGRIWAEAEQDKGATFFFTLGEEA